MLLSRCTVVGFRKSKCYLCTGTLTLLPGNQPTSYQGSWPQQQYTPDQQTPAAQQPQQPAAAAAAAASTEPDHQIPDMTEFEIVLSGVMDKGSKESIAVSIYSGRVFEILQAMWLLVICFH